MFNFERLLVWQKSISLADHVYSLTRSFPADERFGLSSQMRRAAVSISSNVAEGSSRHSRVDYARYVEIAAGSLFELVSQTTIARNQGLLTSSEYSQIYASALEILRMLTGLRSSLERARS